MKKETETYKWMTPAVSGNRPIREREMALRMRANDPIWPSLLPFTLALKPREKGSSRRPPRMRPRLKIRAVNPFTPKSLRAFSVQLNQGEVYMAKEMRDRVAIGLIIPHSPAILIQWVFTDLTSSHS